MAILAKVSKPALTPHCAVVKDLPSGGAASVEGITLLSEAGTTAVTLADGSYNGQMAIVVNTGGGGAKTVTPASAIGASSTAVANSKAVMFVWTDDGTTSGWAAIGANGLS